MDLPDLTALPLASVLGLALIFAFADTLTAVVIAIGAGNFAGEYVADFIRTHVLLRVFPIAALAAVGVGIPELDIPAIPAASLGATGLLTLYGVEVLASIRGSWVDKAVAP